MVGQKGRMVLLAFLPNSLKYSAESQLYQHRAFLPFGLSTVTHVQKLQCRFLPHLQNLQCHFLTRLQILQGAPIERVLFE